MKKIHTDTLFHAINSCCLILVEFASKEWSDDTKFTRIYRRTKVIEFYLNSPHVRNPPVSIKDGNFTCSPEIEKDAFMLMRMYIRLNELMCKLMNRIKFSNDSMDKLNFIHNQAYTLVDEILDILDDYKNEN